LNRIKLPKAVYTSIETGEEITRMNHDFLVANPDIKEVEKHLSLGKGYS
jgi:hypothetical protein